MRRSVLTKLYWDARFRIGMIVVASADVPEKLYGFDEELVLTILLHL